MECNDLTLQVSHEVKSRGEFVLQFLRAFDQAGLDYVYLRNYEEIPESVGHDVDLLVSAGARGKAVKLIQKTAAEFEWRYLGYVEFSPYAVFVASPNGDVVLHIDLFDRIERHWCEFADVPLILGRRMHTGMVYRPHLLDEVYMNLCTRWIYISVVRDKHKEQLAQALAEEGESKVYDAFEAHLGKKYGSAVCDIAVGGHWEKTESMVRVLRVGSWIEYGVKRPMSVLRGIGRYWGRTLRRLVAPPAPFVVILGADGVGKSSAIERIIPLLEDITGISDPLHFHWKPCRASIRKNGDTATIAHDPRAKKARGGMGSLAYLVYHWLGFWAGWVRWVYPQLVRNRSAIGDRYAFDMYMDPERFRLRLPGWLLRLAYRTVPQPDLVLGLTAEPSVVISRKAELTQEEIESYQSRMKEIGEERDNVCIVDASESLSVVSQKLRLAVLKWAEKR